MHTSTFIVLRAVVAALALVPAVAFAIDLSESYARALAADPDLRAADQALRAGREKAVQGNALLKPQIGLSGGISAVDKRASFNVPAALAGVVKSQSSGTAQQVALQLSKPLYDQKA